MRLRRFFRFSAVIAGLIISVVATAQQAPTLPKAALSSVPPASPRQIIGPSSFGPSGLTYVRSSGLNYYPYLSTSGYVSSANERWTNVALGGLETDLRVPTGAIIDYLELDACDNNVTVDMSLSILECDPIHGACTSPASVTTTGAPGCVAVSLSGIGYQVDNASHAISLEAVDAAGDGSLTIGGSVVGYRLQVSPAPLTSDFGDVPTSSPQFQFIEALFHSGITVGCGGGNYCPNNPVTRGQMAVYLAKALGLAFPN